MKKRDRERLLFIDDARLDREWLSQSGMALRIGEELAQARHDHAVKKAACDAEAGRLKLAVRREPERYDLPARPSADLVEACVLQQSAYRRKHYEELDAKYLVDQLTAALNACEHRKRSLENLVDLARMGFHSEPKARDRDDGERFRDKSVDRGGARPIARRKRG